MPLLAFLIYALALSSSKLISPVMSQGPLMQTEYKKMSANALREAEATG